MEWAHLVVDVRVVEGGDDAVSNCHFVACYESTLAFGELYFDLTKECAEAFIVDHIHDIALLLWVLKVRVEGCLGKHTKLGVSVAFDDKVGAVALLWVGNIVVTVLHSHAAESGDHLLHGVALAREDWCTSELKFS